MGLSLSVRFLAPTTEAFRSSPTIILGSNKALVDEMYASDDR